MTEVKLSRKNGTIHLEVSGHAEYAPEGADIVCAACSTLTGTLATKISNMPVKSDIRFKSGMLNLNISMREAGIYLEEIMHCIDFVMLGFSILEEKYPSNVIIVEW